MNNSINGYEYIAHTLKGYGVTSVFYIEAMLRMALRELDKIGVKGILAHSENAAGYMADGYARITGRPGVCMAQSIGAANMAGGIHDAWLSNTPVIAITGKKTAPYQYRNSYQESDHRLFYESITKFNTDLTQPEQLPYLLRQCFREAVTCKPGPVHLDIINQMGRTIELAVINEPLYIEETYKQYPAYKTAAEDDKVEKAAKLINEAQKPVIVAGRGTIISNANSEIYALSHKCDIPVVTTPDGKTIIDEDDSHWTGIVGNYGMDCANRTVINADLVIFIGTQASDQTTLDWKAPKRDVKAIQIDIESSELGRNYPRTIGLLGDAKTVTSQLIEKVNKLSHVGWRKEVEVYKTDTMAESEGYLNSDDIPIRPERLCSEISKVLPDNAVLVADTGFSAVWSATMIRMRPTQRYFRAAGSLGWAFPASLGVKCGAPERPVVCFAGDGAIYYHLSELETAVRYGINTVTIINNNQILNQCSGDIKKVYKDEIEKAASCFTFTPVNFSKIAEEMGCFAIRVDKPKDIAPSIRSALVAGKPAVVEILTDKSATVSPALKCI